MGFWFATRWIRKGGAIAFGGAAAPCRLRRLLCQPDTDHRHQNTQLHRGKVYHEKNRRYHDSTEGGSNLDSRLLIVAVAPWAGLRPFYLGHPRVYGIIS